MTINKAGAVKEVCFSNVRGYMYDITVGKTVSGCGYSECKVNRVDGDGSVSIFAGSFQIVMPCAIQNLRAVGQKLSSILLS